MRRHKIDSQIERQLLTALIMSNEFLGQAYEAIDLDVVDSQLFRRIAKWCLKYYQTYQKAPRGDIESIFHAWVDRTDDNDLVESVHDFLEDISEQYDRAPDINVPYLLDMLSDFLSKKTLEKLQDHLDAALAKGDTKKAGNLVTEYKTVEVGKTAGIDPLNDKAVWDRAFSEPAEPLITFPGDAGRFFNRALTRDTLIGIQGPEKRGKTFWCLEFAIRALRGRKKVAVFEVGDLSESQLMLRLGVRLSSQPMSHELCGKIERPVKVERDDDEEVGYRVIAQDRHCPTPISRRGVLRSKKKFMRACGIPPRQTYIQVSIHPNNSINVRGIGNILDRWAVEKNFIPDVIIIDYADILAPEETRKEERHQTNSTWKALRRLSQERHACVIVPTQADAASYDARTQGMKHFSEDKRKYSHVTGMLGLNQTPEEKEINGMRLNWIVLRESPFNTRRCLYVGTCFTLGRAFCCATL